MEDKHGIVQCDNCFATWDVVDNNIVRNQLVRVTRSLNYDDLKNRINDTPQRGGINCPACNCGTLRFVIPKASKYVISTTYTADSAALERTLPMLFKLINSGFDDLETKYNMLNTRLDKFEANTTKNLNDLYRNINIDVRNIGTFCNNFISDSLGVELNKIAEQSLKRATDEWRPLPDSLYVKLTTEINEAFVANATAIEETHKLK